MKKYSYAEAYTNYLHYCEKKLNIPFEVLVEKYRINGTERKFRQIYNNSSVDLTDSQYYNKLKEV